jgi:2-amino-4-hydroxy-6-hydroxymethyldihydropteridine diphosphokinase
MHQVFLGLGANIGRPEQQLRWAVRQLCLQKGIECVRVSSLYSTKPVGGDPQPDYLNAAVSFKTHKTAREVLELGLFLEEKIGRKRTKKNAPRLLDIDLLLYNGAVISEPGLQVPHEDLAQRAFVLVPLKEIAPEVRHPLLGQTMAELLASISPEGTRCSVAGSAWAGINEE